MHRRRLRVNSAHDHVHPCNTSFTGWSGLDRRWRGGTSHAGFALHGIRGAFSFDQDQVYLAVGLDGHVLVCRSPTHHVALRVPERASRESGFQPPRYAGKTFSTPACPSVVQSRWTCASSQSTLVFAFFCFHKVPETLCFAFTFALKYEVLDRISIPSTHLTPIP